KKIKLETKGDGFVEKLYHYESMPLSEDSLLNAIQALVPNQSNKTTQTGQRNEDKEILSNREKMNSLQEEVVTYIYYLFTILQFFNNSLSEGALTRKGDEGTLDYLAKARQMLAVNPGITRTMLNRFRKLHMLSDVEQFISNMN